MTTFSNENIFLSHSLSLPIERDMDDYLEFQKKISEDYLTTIGFFPGNLRDKLTPKVPGFDNNGDLLIKYSLLS